MSVKIRQLFTLNWESVYPRFQISDLNSLDSSSGQITFQSVQNLAFLLFTREIYFYAALWNIQQPLNCLQN